ncbi:hypothetical protein [Geopseudomonas aromaticivorans]
MTQSTKHELINLGAAKLAEILQDLVSNLSQDSNGDFHIPQTAAKAVNAAKAACNEPSLTADVWWEGGMPGFPETDCPLGVDYQDWVNEELEAQADVIKASATRPGGAMADGAHQLALACAELVAGARAGNPLESVDRVYAQLDHGIDFKALDAEAEQAKAVNEKSGKLSQMIAILQNFGPNGDAYSEADIDALEAVVTDLGVSIPQEAEPQLDTSPAPAM